MSIGESGRIVVEIPIDTKRELHAQLCREGRTLKDWFLLKAEEYIKNSKQLEIFDMADTHQRDRQKEATNG